MAASITHRKIARLLLTLETAAALVLIGLFYWTSSQRLFFPYELHWMEGGSVEHVYQILAGRTIYPPPSLRFLPYTYTPLYYYLSALVSLPFGPHYWCLRLVSWLAFSGTLLLLYVLVRSETGSRCGGIVAAGLLAGCYSLTDYWYDTARNDSLLLFFLSCAVWLLRPHQEKVHPLLAALLVSCAFFTKQVALPILLPVVLLTAARRPVERRRLLLATLAFIGIPLAVMSAVSEGWFWFYVFTAPRVRWEQFVSWPHLAYSLLADIALPLFGAAALMAVSAMRSSTGLRARLSHDSRFQYYAVALATLCAGGLFGRLEAINWINTLMPTLLSVSLLVGLVYGSVWHRSSNVPLRTLVCTLLVGQFLALIYDPTPRIPSTADVARGETFVAALRAIPGTVYLADHAFLVRLADKESFAHTIGVSDFWLGASPEQQELLKSRFEPVFSNGCFDRIVFDGGQYPTALRSIISGHYAEDTESPLTKVTVPVLGFQLPPFVLKPREPKTRHRDCATLIEGGRVDTGGQ